MAKRVYSGFAGRGGPPRGGGGMGAPGGGGDGGMFEMNVPGHKVGLIIGRGGKTVKQLQERSGAKITIIQDSPKVAHEKPLRIKGDPGAVEAAKELVTEILNRNDGDVGGFSPPRKRFRQKSNGFRGRRGCIQCQSKEKRPRYSRFIKPDPNAEDSEHTSIAQEVQDENEGRLKVPGSSPTDDYRPIWTAK